MSDARPDAPTPATSSGDRPQPIDPDAWRAYFPPAGYWVRVAGIVIGLIAVVRLLAILEGILIVTAASLVLAIGLQPILAWLGARDVPRGVAMALLILTGLGIAAGAGFVMVPVVLEQLSTLVDTLPDYIEGLGEDNPVMAAISDRLMALQQPGSTAELPEGAVAAVGTAARTVFDLLLVLTLTPYFALALPRTKRWLVRLMVRGDREEALRLLNRSTSLMANYIVGNLLVSVIAGVVTYVGLLAIGVPYAAALAVFVAVTDLIPAVGATIGAAACIGVAATQGTGPIIGTVVLTVGYQQVENFVIVPRVMRQAIDVQPVTGIMALLVGGTLAGPIGALLALPVAAMIRILLTEFYLKDRMAKVRAADAVDQEARLGRSRRGARAPRTLP